MLNAGASGVRFLMVLWLGPWVLAEATTPENNLLVILEEDVVAKRDFEPSSAPIDAVRAGDTDPFIAEYFRPVVSDPNNDLLFVKTPSTTIQRELWKTRVGFSEEPDASQAGNELDQIIQQINAIEIASPVRAVEPEDTIEPVPPVEPNEIVAHQEPSPFQPGKPAESKATAGSVSEQTLERFKVLCQTPNQLANPLELADIFFESGCLTEAGICYQEVLNRLNAGQTDLFEDKAWILLQLGICLRKENPQAALENYETVISEFPYSPWAALAKAKSDLIRWYLKDQPEMLIVESKSKMNE
jgi:tetratricopeptide (TPR) repeat protein